MSSHEIIVSDTSCLINLERIDSLFLLEKLFDKIIVTEEVAAEFGVILPEYFEIQPSPKKTTRELFDQGLDLGESSSIALAVESGKDCLLLLDDKAAREEARRRGLQFIGLIGVLLRAKEKGILHEIKPSIERLKDVGFRMSELLMQRILREAGEGE